MGVTVREAKPGDLAVLVELRLAFLAEHRGVPADQLPAGFAATTEAFFRRHIAAGTVRSWIAEDDGQAQGQVSVLLLDMAPRPEDTNSIDGFVINMYVVPPRRRRGVGRRLLDELLAAVRQQGIRRLMLYATPDGAPLYVGAGFRSRPDFLELALAGDSPG